MTKDGRRELGFASSLISIYIVGRMNKRVSEIPEIKYLQAPQKELILNENAYF
jgi:hypothetical protein